MVQQVQIKIDQMTTKQEVIAVGVGKSDRADALLAIEKNGRDIALVFAVVPQNQVVIQITGCIEN